MHVCMYSRVYTCMYAYMYDQQQNKRYPKGVYFPISKLHSMANLLAHNNKWLCYYGQVNSVRLNIM